MSDTDKKEETELQPLIHGSRETEETAKRIIRLHIPTSCDANKTYVDQKDIIIASKGQPNGDVVNNVPHGKPPDTIDGKFTQPVERDEIFSPGKTNNYIVGLPFPPEAVPKLNPKRPLDDETDNEPNKAKETEDDEEPWFSFSNPASTEEIVEASQSPDGTRADCCFLFRSSWIEKKFNELILAVNYHETEKMKTILDEVQPSTLVKLLTKRDQNGQPCIMKAITRQSLNCIQPLLEKLEELDFGSYDKMDALRENDKSENKKNILHVAAQIVRDQAIINEIDIYDFMETLADSQDNNGTTPLIVASQYQNHLMARRLVSYKAKIDHVDNNGYSPIYWATATGSAETLKLFLVHGARDTTDQLELFKKHSLYNRKGTILQAIVESRCPKTLQVCLEIHNGKAHIIECLKEELGYERTKTFIHAVCETPLVNLIKLAIQDTEYVLKRLGDDDVTPLMKATEARQLDIVKLILSTTTGKKTLSSQKLSTKETALMIACKNEYSEIVQFIMENSDKDMDLGQLDEDSRNVFHHAAKHDEILPQMIYICRRMEKYKNYKCYLKLQDNDGYVSLHHAAASGSSKNVKLLLENDVPYNTPSSRLGRTALHYAACSNVSTVKHLLEFVKTKFSKDAVKQFIDAVDSRLQTSLHIAASLGKWQTVAYLLENGATIKCDKENETPLHLASYIGSTKTVEFLIRHNQTIVNNENRVGETPAMFAAVNGKTETLQMLLKNNAKLWAQSHCDSVEKRKTCLDWAVMNKKSDTAMAILKQDDWKETMKKSYLGPDGLLASMVISMPNVAMEVLNKCEEKKNYEAIYDFFALQTREELQICGRSTKFVTSMKALETMAKYSRNDCLNHAVVQRFLDQKWSLRARKWYLCCLFIYTVFLISFTTYITLVAEDFRPSDNSSMFAIVICYVFTSLSVIKELVQLLHRKLQFFCMVSSYLDIVMYTCVFIFLPNEEKSNFQRQAGAIAIFLAWINFTWFLKRCPTYGIYVIMAKKIFVTFIKVFVPISFFIVAFSMTFFILLHNKDEEGFANIVRSFVTSFAMMVGELDYRGTFLRQTGSNFVLIMVFLTLFLILMSILLMNLLTGLAVGDIGVIMKRSFAEKQRQQAMLIVDMDRHLNKYPGLGAKYVEPLTITQKPRTCAMNCLQKLVDKMFPRLDIDDEKESKKPHGCDCPRVKEKLITMQNTLEEMKRSFMGTQVTTLPKKTREFPEPRRNTVI